MAAAIVGGLFVVGGQLATVKLVDVGVLPAPWLFYAAIAIAPIVVGSVLRTRWSLVASGVSGAILATFVFYKRWVQNGEATELGNAFDWAVVLLLTFALIPAAAFVGRRRDRDRSF
jgi:hypothetical protein